MRAGMAPLLLVVCGLSCCTGCTLLGPFVGGAVPSWEHGVPPDDIAAYKEKGEPLDVHVVLDPEPGIAPQRDPIDGSYVAQTATDLIVSAEGGRRVIPLVGVRRVDVRTGSYWLAGLALGFLADVVTAALIVVLLPRGHAD